MGLQVAGIVQDERVRARLSKLAGSFLMDALEQAQRQIGQQYLGNLRAATPRGPTGNLQAAQSSKVSIYKETAVLMFGPRWTGGQHQHLVEWGTKPRFTRNKKGRKVKSKKGYRGSIKAQHYMENWFAANKGSIADRLTNEVNAAVGAQLYS